MPPELSRRLARAIHAAQPNLKTRDRIIREASGVESFERFPAWLQRFVNEAEKADPPDGGLAPKRQISLKRRTFDESQVRRDADGQFADKPGRGSGPKKSPFKSKNGQTIQVGSQVTSSIPGHERGRVVDIDRDGSPIVQFEGRDAPSRFTGPALTIVSDSPSMPEKPSGAAPKPALRGSVPALRKPLEGLRHPSSERGYRDALPETDLGKGGDFQAVYDYAWDGRSYVEMNGALRTGATPSEKTQKSVDDLTAALAKHRLPHPVIVNRGVENSEENRRWFRANIGQKVSDEGFISSSLDRQAAEDFAEAFSDGQGNGIIVRMKVPAGAQGVYIGSQFDEMGGFNQEEVLLQRGGEYRISSVKNQGGWMVVEMTMEGQLNA